MKLILPIIKLLLILPFIGISGCQLPFQEEVEKEKIAAARAYLEQGNALKKSGDLKGAMEKYTKAIEIDPTNSNYYLQRGLISDSYAMRGIVRDSLTNYQRAIADYTQAIDRQTRKTGSNYLHFYRAQAYHRLGQYTLAKFDYQKSVSLDANKDISLFRIALIDYEIGSSQDEIIENLKKIKNIFQQDYKDLNVAEIQMLIAIAFYSKGESEKAIEMAKKALTKHLYYYSNPFIYLEADKLRENFGGESLVQDIENFYSIPEMQAILPQKKSQSK
ncbi:MAG: tetratricopeptide repeat protein [Prochloraceae cyanobacterium]|nr:tetratricopeptide repeat protein [Prochloraceae cyanobacterium]